MNVRFTVAQTARYVGDDTWEWAVWLEGRDAELDLVDHVVYTLHRTYPKPVRTVDNRVSKFRLETSGWGTFTIYVEVVLKDGKHISLEHELQLLYPEEQLPRKPIDSRGIAGIQHRMDAPGPKRLLAIESGGVRSLISLEILERLETVLREKVGDPKMVLADYFDFVGGTSTGALVSAGIALGRSVAEIREFYLYCLPMMFHRTTLLKRLRYKYESEPFATALKEMFGDVDLGSDKLRTMLMIVLRNETIDQPWIVSNNPNAKYNRADRFPSELSLPLWQLVRASSAAPTYFPPEVIRSEGHEVIVTDGSLTGYGNPAFQLFLRATAEPYQVRWPTGEDRLLLVSVGSGFRPYLKKDLRPEEMNLMWSAASVPTALLSSMERDQDLLCRMFGKCLVGSTLDREVGDMIGMGGPVTPKLFTYLRYSPVLDRNGLLDLGLEHIQAEDVQASDCIDKIDQIRQVGKVFAKASIRPEHYVDFVAQRH